MRYHSAIASLAAAAALASSAFGGPREGATYTNVSSDLPNNGTQVKNFAASGAYPVTHITISGTLSEVVTSTFAREAIVVAHSPAGNAYVMQPFRVADITGTVDTPAFTYKLPVAEPSAAGTWNIYFLETFDDGAGPDATWTTITITLNDGPPAAIDIGGLETGPATYAVELAANETRWIRFSTGQAMKASAFTYLDIDTEGSTLGGSDSVISLYNADGNRVAYNDDSGSGLWSQLSFGAGVRPAVGSGVPYAGQDGELPAGVYYLGVRSIGGSNEASGWGFTRTSLNGVIGPVKVNIRTNAGTPGFCKSDFNKSGASDVADIFSFLTAWFGGCP